MKKIIEEKKNEGLKSFDSNLLNVNKVKNDKVIYENAKEKYNLIRTNRYMTDYIFNSNNNPIVEVRKSTSRSKSRKRRYVDIENNPINDTPQFYIKKYKFN